MRSIKPTRSYGRDHSLEVQILIDQKPSTIKCYRISGDGISAAKTSTLVATFEGRIDPSRLSGRGGLENLNFPAGLTSSVIYTLVTRKGTDKNGATIDYKHGDKLVIGTQEYRVLSIEQNTSWKIEATVEQYL